MDRPATLPPDSWERTPPEAHASMRMLEARVAALDINSFTPVRMLADCVGTAEVLQYSRGVSHVRSVCFASPRHTCWSNCNSSDTVGLTPHIGKGNHDEPCHVALISAYWRGC